MSAMTATALGRAAYSSRMGSIFIDNLALSTKIYLTVTGQKKRTMAAMRATAAVPLDRAVYCTMGAAAAVAVAAGAVS